MTRSLLFRACLAEIPLRVVAAWLVFLILPVCASTSWAQAQNYSVIYSFCGGPNDGQFPYGDLIADSAGNLYGTTREGGMFGGGTVFEISANGTETVLYSFGAKPGDGLQPVAGLVRDGAGNLYGTTYIGGVHGNGTVFELSPDGTETVLVSFNDPDGQSPWGNLLRDSAGNLYGTTAEGGTLDNGTVFKVFASGKESALYSFAGGPNDGQYPSSGLIQDSSGSLYGTTAGGGVAERGAVFRVSKPGADTLLYSFGGPPDGEGPAAGLLRDASGNLYGTTVAGGLAEGCGSQGLQGCGTVFKLTPAGTEAVLYTFTDGADGGVPYSGLVMDSKGNLYGTGSEGGSGSFCSAGGEHFGCGVVYEVTTEGKEKVLHTFTEIPPDGSTPYGGLLVTSGALYGTTTYGGNGGCGTVYKLVP